MSILLLYKQANNNKEIRTDLHVLAVYNHREP